MYYAGTVFGRDIVAQDHLESTFVRTEPGDELLIGQPLQGSAFALGNHVSVQQFRLLVGFAFGKEVAEQGLGQYDVACLAAVGMGGLHQHIVDGGSHTQCSVRWERPRSGSPHR